MVNDDHLNTNYPISICDLKLLPHTERRLLNKGIDSVEKLLGLSRQQLISNKIISSAAVDGLVHALEEHDLHLLGEKLYICTSCGKQFSDIETQSEDHFCVECSGRVERLRRIKDFEVTLDGPVYDLYSDNSDGYTIHATIHNRTKKTVEVVVNEFMVFLDNRQWAPDSYLKGYHFERGFIFPNTAKTIAKIWTQLPAPITETLNENVTFSFSNNNAQYFYKFVLKNNNFELWDYHTY